jgi:hypothetical protein
LKRKIGRIFGGSPHVALQGLNIIKEKKKPLIFFKSEKNAGSPFFGPNWVCIVNKGPLSHGPWVFP